MYPIKFIGYPAVALAIATLLYVFYLLIFPLSASTPLKQPFTVISKQVSAGGTLRYEAAICKHIDNPGIINRQLLGAESKQLDSEPSNIPKGCNTSIRNITIPKDIIPGEYKLIIFVTYKVNAIHSIDVRYETEEFEIIK